MRVKTDPTKILVTARGASKRRARAARRPRLDELLDATATAVIVARRDGHIEWLSLAAAELLERNFPSTEWRRLPDLLLVRSRGTPGRSAAAQARREIARYRVAAGNVSVIVREVPIGSRRLLTLDERTARQTRAAQQPFGLTRREAEILEWVTLGKTNAEIAAILTSRPHTVKKHLEHVYAKLDVRSRTAATALVLRGVDGNAHPGAA